MIRKKVYKQFGEEIKSRRIAMSLTQAELAERVSMHREAIVILEKGTYGNVNLFQLERFAKAFNLHPLTLAKAIWQ